MDLENTMSVKETAAYLHISTKTVYRWITEGKLRAQKVGLQLFIDKDMVEAVKGGQSIYVDNLIQRIDNLEQRLAELERNAQSSPAPPTAQPPPTTRDEQTKPSAPHSGAIPEELPEGTLHILDFLMRHKLKSHRRKIIGYLDIESNGLRFRSFPKPNRPGETDRYLEPLQQDTLLAWLHVHHPEVFTTAGPGDD